MNNYSFIRWMLLLVVLLARHSGQAQQISAAELVAFFEGGPIIAQQVLLPRGWLYTGIHNFQDSVQHCSGSSHLFGRPLTPPDSTGYGQWISVDTEGNCPRVVQYQTTKKATVDVLKQELKKQCRMTVERTFVMREGPYRVNHLVYVGPLYRAQIIERWQAADKHKTSVQYSVYVGRQR